MLKGMILRSRATGLAFTVVETNGSQVRVRDENGKLINNWFDNEFFLKAKD